ncbi:MAG: ribbon-helix-helix protein, CopG family [Nostoc sp. NMS7]|uniref:ribbon-helix-helix protein, CopG family n=1 Tax=Nostoc sp. NMS7 TaxID=2815391 RepID=UPI0025FD430A|nr:ribbon-helix-helix protein, CopG family [Nostoc sp. NMS7]MBN3944975.1 ribbon-helix-helix protein, CopG family [Nostoc sp. NMS7]
MNKKSRNSLTDLLSEINLQELEPEPTAKLKPERQVKQLQKSSQKSTPNLLEKIKKQQPAKITRITVDLDPETYEQLEHLIEYTGLTKAKLLRALIKETAKLLQKSQ